MTIFLLIFRNVEFVIAVPLYNTIYPLNLWGIFGKEIGDTCYINCSVLWFFIFYRVLARIKTLFAK